MRVVAQTGDRFTGFGPYVPSINNRGEVAFQATLNGGGTGVYVEGRTIRERDPEIGDIVSHPDVNDRGDVCFYAQRHGTSRLIVLGPSSSVDFESPFPAGPLGPTINESGVAAYRGALPSGETVVLSSGSSLIAQTGEIFREFHGLPLMLEDGRVVFRADLTDGTPGVFLDGHNLAEGLDEIGRFPCADGEGRTGFVARKGANWAIWSGDRPPRPWTPDVNSDLRFESLRGVLINSRGIAAYYAVPIGGRLGIYRPDQPEPILEMNGNLFGSMIIDFALNPVSVNASGQIAVRVRLADEREFILAG